MSWTTEAVAMLVDAVAASSSFQALVGASNSAAAKARIIAYTTGAPGFDAMAEGQARAVTGATFSLLDTPHAAIFLTGVQRALAGINTFDTTCTGTLRIAVTRRQTGEDPEDWFSRAVDTAEDIRADIEAQNKFPLLRWDGLEVSTIEDGPQPKLTLVDHTFTIEG